MIRHNITTKKHLHVVLCRFPLCHLGGSVPSGHYSTKPLGVNCGTTDPLGAVGCGLGSPWIKIACPVHPMGAQWNWDLGIFLSAWPLVYLLWCTGCSAIIKPVFSKYSMCYTGFQAGSGQTAWPLLPTSIIVP